MTDQERNEHDNSRRKPKPETTLTQPFLPPEQLLLPPEQLPLPPEQLPLPPSSLEVTQPGMSEPTQPVQPVPPPTVQQPPYQAPPGYNAPGYAPPPGDQGYAPPPPPGYGPPGYGAPPGQPAPAKRGKKRRRKRRGTGGGCLITLMVAAAVFLGLTLTGILLVVLVFGQRLESRLDQIENLQTRRTFQTTVIYDRDGEELYQVFGEGRRTIVQLENLPPYVAQASIAIEDDSFYSNPGIDIGSIFRALFQNIEQGEVYSGASTITQQVVDNVIFETEYRYEISLQRKIDEAILALILTGRMSKDDILELYLNEIYYGNLAYGVEAAAQTIFGKPAAELTLGEAALLAGLPQAPAELDPLNPDPDIQNAVYARQRLVLDRMVEVGFITQQEADDAYAAGLSFGNPDVELRAPHFTVYAQEELERLLATLHYSPEEIAAGGMRVYTSLDLDLQDMAQRIAQQQVAALRDAHDLSSAAVVVLHPFTGEILAMVGSADYWDESIDGRVNVSTAPRQPGSTMKPFTYAAAMELGWDASTIIWDTETHIEIPGQPDYVPVNYDSAFHGPVRVRDALANSYNIPAVQTLREVGVDYLLQFMQRFGVESLGTDASRFGLSLTLGGGEVTLLELTRAYGVFANGGLLVPSTAITCILDDESNIIYQYENRCPEGRVTERTQNFMAYGQEVLDERIAFVISDILGDNAARTPAMGSSSPLNTGSLPASAKTGTTNDYRDNWTVGFTRNVVVGVWAGNANNTAMRNTSGLTGAAPIWNAVITGIYNDPALSANLAQNGQLRDDVRTVPGGISSQPVCQLSGLQDPIANCPTTRTEYFLDTPARIRTADASFIESTEPLAPPLQVGDPNSTGPQPTEVERGLFHALVQPLPEALAQAIQFEVQPGDPTPPAPKYCLVPQEVAEQIPTAQTLLFIGPPRSRADAIYATRWAYAANTPILPLMPCTGEMLTASLQEAGSGAPLPPVVTAYISSPAPGQEVRDNISIMGTAAFRPEQAQYYKIEIRGAQFPDWVTLGMTHSQPVVDGPLETLAAAGLQPGQYFLRLIIIGHDSNYLQEPYEVPFIVP